MSGPEAFAIAWFIVAVAWLIWVGRTVVRLSPRAAKPKVGEWRIVKDPHAERYEVQRLRELSAYRSKQAVAEVLPSFFPSAGGYRAWVILTEQPSEADALDWIAREKQRPIVVHDASTTLGLGA